MAGTFTQMHNGTSMTFAMDQERIQIASPKTAPCFALALQALDQAMDCKERLRIR